MDDPSSPSSARQKAAPPDEPEGLFVLRLGGSGLGRRLDRGLGITGGKGLCTKGTFDLTFPQTGTAIGTEHNYLSLLSNVMETPSLSSKGKKRCSKAGSRVLRTILMQRRPL